MTDTQAAPEFGSYAALFRRRRIWILTIVPAVLLFCVYLAYSLPAQYRSTATIILELASIPDQLIQTTVASAPEQQIEIIQGRALTLEALQGLVAEIDPYPEHPEWDAGRKAQQIIADTSLERVDPVTFKPQERSQAFSMYYQNPNPGRAALVADRLVGLFLSYHQRTRVDAAKAGAKLLEDRANALGNELQQVDEQYARLRSQHGGALPDASDRSEDARYRAARDLDDREKDLRAAQEQEALLNIQLSGISPNLMASNGDLTDLATVKAQLADAEQRYTPDHPDVKRLRRAMAALLAQGARQNGAPAGSADNPEYRRIASQLASARTNVAALLGATARARQQLVQYTANLNPSPEVAQKAAELERRHTSLQAQFQEVQMKLKSAQMGQVVEADDTHAEHFSLVRAPYAATTPFSPNRLGIILLGLVLGGAIAAAAVAIAESTDATVRGSRDVVGFHGIPVLGSVSELLLPADLQRRKLVWGSVFAVYALATAFVVMTIAQASSRDHRVETASTTQPGNL